MIRKPAVAGGFYPRFKDELKSSIDNCFLDKNFGPGKALEIGTSTERTIFGGISPHAGYTYSGPATAITIHNLCSEGAPDTVIILGTQHTGYYNVGIMESGMWETPFGKIQIDDDLAKSILNESSIITQDESAFLGFPHGREHNIEVQLPFIQYISMKAKKEIKFIPIKIGAMDFEKIKEIGEKIGRSVKKQSDTKDIVIIASSDMTHKSPKNFSKPKKDLEDMLKADELVMNSIKTYNESETLKNAKKTSVCGPQTISTAMCACREIGASKAEILKYYNSYEKMGGKGPCEYSVGYLSAIFRK